MRAYQDRVAYVRPRIEMSGLALDTLELDGADLTDMHGYADIFPVPNIHHVFMVPKPHFARPITRIKPTTVVTFKVPRIEPHQNPPWQEPSGEFE
jgi:hypothetical protein